MKLLIRTITIATIGFFMILISLHSTIVETVKHQLDVASNAALNRTVDAWERNRKLLRKGETTNLYFSTDEEFYWFFYDSLAVQLNGNVDVLVMANDIDVNHGILDVDTTVTYYGLDRKERTYTVHADTYRMLSNWVDNSPERLEMLKNLSEIPEGALVQWGKLDGSDAMQEWYMFNASDDNSVALISKTNKGTGPYSYESPLKYETSELDRHGKNATTVFDEMYKTRIATKTMTQLNYTEYGVFNENISYSPAVSWGYIPSKSEIEQYNSKVVQNYGSSSGRELNNVWSRTLVEKDYAYVPGAADNKANIWTDSAGYRVVVNIDKDWIDNLTILKDPDSLNENEWVYVIE